MPKPIKILHVISSLNQRDGGPVRAIVDLSPASEEYGVESHLLAPGPLELPDNPLPAGRIHITPPAVFHAFRYAPSLRRWLRRHVSQFATWRPASNRSSGAAISSCSTRAAPTRPLKLR